MSGSASKEKGGKFWKKLGLGKKSSAEGTLSRPASIISRASSTDRLSDMGPNIRLETSESTSRSKRRSHRRAASEIDSNFNRSHSTVNFGKTNMGSPNQASRSTLQTMKYASPNSDNISAAPWTSENLDTESERTMNRNTMSTENKITWDQQSASELQLNTDVTTKENNQCENNQCEVNIPNKLSSKPTLLDHTTPTETIPTDQLPVDQMPSISISSRSNLPKLTSLRASSSSIPRTPSASSLRQQASQLRQPSRSVKSRNSYDTLKEPITNVPKSYMIVNMPVNTNIDELQNTESTSAQDTSDLYYPLDDEQSVNDREAELLFQLEREKAVNRVLQGQKAAINKDLEYLSQMVDDLSSENEQLKEQYEDQKQIAQHSIEDMDLLLEKVKSANASARDAGLEKEALRRELEVQNLEMESRCAQYQDQLLEKNNEVRRLKAQLDQSKEQIKVLKSTMEQLIRINVGKNEKEDEQLTQTQSPERLTPATSPDIQTAKVPPMPTKLSQRQSLGSEYSEERITSPRSATFDLHDDTEISHYHTSPSLSTKRTSMTSNYSKRDSTLFYDEGDDDLDDQMRLLVKQKERLQSDYSKIPIVGGGPTSRKRREDLEEQLDNIDSQLSKIKLKIRSRA